MATADEVIVQFEARMNRYEADLKRAQRAFRDSTESQRSDMARLEAQISRSSGQIGGQLRGLAATFAAAFSAQQIAQLADGYTRFTNVLAVSGLEGENLANVQEKLFGTAQKYGVELESLGQLFGRASQSAGELNASQAELLQFTDGVSAALKIQGASAASSSGALLQLSQALGAGIVRAEEYNSINEGALPILQAVARNLDGAGGSVAKLRALVLDGKVTSEDFFRAFLAGSAQLEAQAAKSSLTIENSFTVLNNALGRYIGQTDDSLSATERISGAIIALSENLDTLVTVIAVLSTLLIGRFAASMLTAAGSTGVASAAIFALQARAVGAATTMEALAFAGRAAGTSLLAAFGGPVGLAVAALAGGLLYIATTGESAADSLDRLSASADSAEATALKYEARLRDAGVAVTALGTASDVAKGRVASLGNQMDIVANQALALFNQVNGLELVRIGRRLNEVRQERGMKEGPKVAAANPVASLVFGKIADTLAPGRAEENARERQEQINLLDKEEALLLRQLTAIREGVKAGVDVVSEAEEIRNRPVNSGDKPKPGPKPKAPRAGPTGPTAEEIEERFLGELNRLKSEQLVAEAQLTTNIEDRASIFSELLDLERAERTRQIQNDKDFTKEQKAAQIAALDRLYGTAGGGIDADGNITVERGRQPGLLEQQINRDLRNEQNQQARDMLAMEGDALAAMAAITVSLEERNAMEQTLLGIQQEIERQLLEQQIANGEIADADRARALLATQQSAQQEGLNRDQASPFEQYTQDLQSTATNLNAAVEQLGVDTLKTFNAELINSIVNFKSLGDAGRSVLASLTAGLLDLALQQIFLKLIGTTLGNAAVASSSAQAASVAAAWAPAAALASLATLGSNAAPAAAAVAGVNALTAGLAATGLGRKDGGPITGRGGPRQDKVLIAASPEEYMINARAARALGRSTLDYINATGKVPGRKDGGPIVPSLPGQITSSGRSGSAGIDGAFLRELRAAIVEATRAMPPIELYPTIKPENVLSEALKSPGGRKTMFDFTGANSGKVNAALNG